MMATCSKHRHSATSYLFAIILLPDQELQGIVRLAVSQSWGSTLGKVQIYIGKVGQICIQTCSLYTLRFVKFIMQLPNSNVDYDSTSIVLEYLGQMANFSLAFNRSFIMLLFQVIIMKKASDI